MIFKYKEPLYKHESDFFSEKGTKEIPTYVLDFPDRGGVCLKKTGIKPIYEMIQAILVNCDLQNVIESCVHSNQYSVVTEDNLNTMVADYTGITDLGELYSATKRLEYTWKELPLEVRESFDSDKKKFIKSFGTDEFKDKVTNGYKNFYGSVNKNTIVDVKPPTEINSNSPDLFKDIDKTVDVKKEVTE